MDTGKITSIAFPTDITMAKEGPHLEFKQSSNKLPRSFWETYSSFANTSGGIIVLGLGDDIPRTVVGVNNPDALIQEIFNTANNKEKISHNILNNKSIKCHKIDDKNIITVFVPELPLNEKPLHLNKNLSLTYVRKNEGDFLATVEELRRFIRNAHDNLDSELLDNYTLEDLDEESILEFKNILHIRNSSKQYLQMDNLEFLTEMGIFQIDRNDRRRPKLTLAGLLFLGKLTAIMQRLPHFHLDYVNKRGQDINRWKDRVSTGELNYLNLNLFQYYKIVLNKLKLTVEDTFELDNQSVRKSPVELDIALREALTNMIIHADYLDPETNLKVVVDNFYYTFLNPGTMKVSKEQFFIGGQSIPRNNTLVTYFRRIGACEREGSGGKEIFNVFEKNKFRYPDLTLTPKSTFLKLWTASLDNAYPELSPHTRKVLFFMQEKRTATRKDIQLSTQLSDHFVRKAINDLLDKKYIMPLGNGRSTRYIIVPSKLEVLAAVDSYSQYVASGQS